MIQAQVKRKTRDNNLHWGKKRKRIFKLAGTATKINSHLVANMGELRTFKSLAYFSVNHRDR